MPSVPPADPRSHPGYWIPLLAGAALFALIQTFSKLSPILLAFLLTLLISLALNARLCPGRLGPSVGRGRLPRGTSPGEQCDSYCDHGARSEAASVGCDFSKLLRVSAFGVLGVFGSAPLVAIADILHNGLCRECYLPNVTSASLERLSRLSLPEKFSEGK